MQRAITHPQTHATVDTHRKHPSTVRVRFAPSAVALDRLRGLAAAPRLRAARDLGLFPTADQLDQACPFSIDIKIAPFLHVFCISGFREDALEKPALRFD